MRYILCVFLLTWATTCKTIGSSDTIVMMGLEVNETVVDAIMTEEAERIGAKASEYLAHCKNDIFGKLWPTEEELREIRKEKGKEKGFDDKDKGFPLDRYHNSTDEVLSSFARLYPKMHAFMAKRLALIEKEMINLDADSNKLIRDVGNKHLQYIVKTTQIELAWTYEERQKFYDELRNAKDKISEEEKTQYRALSTASKNNFEKAFCYNSFGRILSHTGDLNEERKESVWTEFVKTLYPYND